MPAPTILTPDQRLRVFVSSTLNELADERAAARRAIERLMLTPVMFELGARPYPPRSLYLAYLRQSHVFVGVYGESYGWTAPDMGVSGLEDELLHASEMPRLIYVKAPAPGREPKLTEMLRRLSETGDASYKKFASPEELETLLAGDLAVLLSERFATPPGRAAVTLPSPPSEFVGRWAELGELVDLLTAEGVRLVTLTGPGGIGKTRLAIEAAHAVADHFPDGIVYVPLAARRPDDFLEAIGVAAGLQDLGQQPLADLLAEHLRDRRELLILDNFEHLVSAAPEVGRLLERTSPLRILVTSRAALRLTGEEEFPVPPLGVPRVTERVEDVLRAEAAQMFCRRVAAVRHGYRLGEADAPTVARICRRLDGLPLALELVAARANVLSVAEIGARLDQVLDLSARSPDIPERQRTLRQTMDWSYAQLPPGARSVFDRLGVFAGSFSLDAAEAVCGGEGDLLEAFAVLVDHSLLRPQLDGGSRFTMLEIVREYARSHLTPEVREEAGARHAAFFHDLATSAEEGLRGPGQREMIRRLDRDADNIGAALDWLVGAGRAGDVAQMAWALWSYTWLRGALTEGRRWTSGALAAPGPMTGQDRGRLLASDGFLATWLRDYERALPELHEALDIAKREDDEEVLMLVSIFLAIPYGGVGDEARARESAEVGLRLARARHDTWAETQALMVTCFLDCGVGKFEGNEATFEAMAAMAEKEGDPMGRAMSFGDLAELRTWQGRYPEAAALLTRALSMFAELRMTNAGAVTLHTTAHFLALHGEWAAAVRLQAASDAANERMGSGLWPPYLPRRERLLADARRELGDAGYEAAWTVGATWSFNRAVEEACAYLSPLRAETVGVGAGATAVAGVKDQPK